MTMKLTVRVVAVVVALFGVSCTRYRVNPGEQRVAYTGVVSVFDKAIPATVHYRIIGDFVMQKQWYGSTGATVEAATKIAAAKGANGILIERTGFRVTAWSWASRYTAGKLLWIAGDDETSASSTAVPPSPKPSIEERLIRLDELRKSGRITEKEYEDRRSSILNEL